MYGHKCYLLIQQGFSQSEHKTRKQDEKTKLLGGSHIPATPKMDSAVQSASWLSEEKLGKIFSNFIIQQNGHIRILRLGLHFVDEMWFLSAFLVLFHNP